MRTTKPFTTRFSPWILDKVGAYFRRFNEDTSTGVRHIVEEWCATEMFDLIEFREVPTGRRAAVRGGPEVWEIISVWRDYKGDPEGFREHFEWLEPACLDDALGYYREFRDQIDKLITANEEYERHWGEQPASSDA